MIEATTRSSVVEAEEILAVFQAHVRSPQPAPVVNADASEAVRRRNSEPLAIAQ